MEKLEKQKPRNFSLGCAVNEDEKAEVEKFVRDRNWRMGAFIRVAIKESMERIKQQEKKDEN